MSFKQVVVINSGVGMRKGKVAVQSCHAVVGAILNTPEDTLNRWLGEGMPKVTLKVQSAKELIDLFEQCRGAMLNAYLVKDAGKTQVKPGTVTALAIGPAKVEDIDKITGKLKLL
jgi:PTH2 family peptidyl-tRNA hydrolase